ncbi:MULTISPECIES: Holliday junction resolvase RuvX [Acidaminococcus]|jgi:putative holliday junction resolvase|uniref:Holliday junction resolvase RuvX n=1 Tax=Acidaminococcus TaxID=904 RepID=UPI0009F45963|nr:MULTISPECIES: Holliday junction resolvase RuvX [Acidaminococcus]MDD6570494.1 Holliday junction resolvase RuvX [Acidaminococcus sp.]MDO5596839.1 Holliday junction resolvase RuvX [Acidaminococcus sp.]
MRIMGLDLGTRTIGVAVSDETGFIARGVETIHRRSLEKDLARLEELVQAEEVGQFVLGYPKNMNGTIGDRARASEEFKTILEERFPSIPVVLWDERLSTVAAEKVLIEADLQRKKRKKIIDMMAAVVILQNYLDSPRRQ